MCPGTGERCFPALLPRDPELTRRMAGSSLPSNKRMGHRRLRSLVHHLHLLARSPKTRPPPTSPTRQQRKQKRGTRCQRHHTQTTSRISCEQATWCGDPVAGDTQQHRRQMSTCDRMSPTIYVLILYHMWTLTLLSAGLVLVPSREVLPSAELVPVCRACGCFCALDGHVAALVCCRRRSTRM